jgi:hypothetical protein
VVSSVRQGESHRIGFCFVVLHPDAREALDVALVDYVLARIEDASVCETSDASSA